MHIAEISQDQNQSETQTKRHATYNTHNHKLLSLFNQSSILYTAGFDGYFQFRNLFY